MILLVTAPSNSLASVEGTEAWILAEDSEFYERRDLTQSVEIPGRTSLRALLSGGSSQVKPLTPERESVIRLASEGSATVEVRRIKTVSGDEQGATMKMMELEVFTECADGLQEEAASVVRLVEALSFSGIEAESCADIGRISSGSGSPDLTLYLAYILCSIAEVAKGVAESCEPRGAGPLRRDLQDEPSFRAQIGFLLLDFLDVFGKIFFPSIEGPDVSCPNVPRYCVTNVGLTPSPGSSFLPECTEDCVRYLESLLSSTSGVTGDIGFLITVLQATKTVAATFVAPVTATIDRVLGTFEAACAPCELNALLCETCTEAAPELGCTVDVDFLPDTPDTPEPEEPTDEGSEGVREALIPENTLLYRCNGESDCRFVNCEEISEGSFVCINSIEESPPEQACVFCRPFSGGRRITGSGSSLGNT